MNILLELFLTFAKIGLFTFGGGYAMISLIDHTCVEKKAWLTHDEMMNITVIAESTPGPIAINCATFTGYQTAGLSGAIVATVGMVLPSFVIIFCISRFLDQFLELAVIANAFQGIRVAVGILILDAGCKMVKKMKKTGLSKAIVLCSCVLMLLINTFSLGFSSISLMLLAGAVSLAVTLALEKKGRAGL